MNTTTRVIALFAVASIYLIGCSKNNSKSGTNGTNDHNGGNGTLTLSQSSVKKGEPLTITAAGKESVTLKWSVFPASFASIATGKGQVVARFAKAGQYLVTASAAGTSDSSTAVINVSDSAYIPDSTGSGIPPGYDTLTVINDSIVLTPIADSNRNLILRAQTLGVYDCFPWFIYGFETGTAGGKHVTIEFDQIVKGANGSCGGVTNAAYAFMYPNILPLGNGDVTFTVKVNHTVYQGTMTITDDTITFNWPYTSGVFITPLQITRHH